jgi:fucose permease
MIEQLSLAFGTTAVGVSAILGTYYYTYSITSLIAGAALDRAGAKNCTYRYFRPRDRVPAL